MTSTPEALMCSITSRYNAGSRLPLPVCGIAHMAMHDGGPGVGGLDGGGGDLLRGDGHMRVLADGVAGAGQGTGHDDVVVHVW
jgi:hypothetical protein